MRLNGVPWIAYPVLAIVLLVGGLDLLHVGGWLLELVSLALLLQAYIGRREFDRTMQRIVSGQDPVQAVEQERSPDRFLIIQVRDALDPARGMQKTRSSYDKVISVWSVAAVILPALLLQR